MPAEQGEIGRKHVIVPSEESCCQHNSQCWEYSSYPGCIKLVIAEFSCNCPCVYDLRYKVSRNDEEDIYSYEPSGYRVGEAVVQQYN